MEHVEMAVEKISSGTLSYMNWTFVCHFCMYWFQGHQYMTDSCTCCKMAKFPAWQTVKCKWTWNDKIHLYHISCTNKQMRLEGVGNLKIEKIWRYRHRGFWKWLRKEPSNLFFWMATIKELIPKCLETVWWIATTLVYDQAERLLDSEFPCVGKLNKMREGTGEIPEVLNIWIWMRGEKNWNDCWRCTKLILNMNLYLLRLEIWLYSWGW